MFNGLDDIQINIIINAMEEKKFSPGNLIIKQNEI